MDKRAYFPNQVIKDDQLPFWLEITSGLNVYARNERGELRRCESLVLKKKGWIVVNYDGYIVTIKAWNEKERRFIYDIREEESE